jgi:hypothetical protein
MGFGTKNLATRHCYVPIKQSQHKSHSPFNMPSSTLEAAEEMRTNFKRSPSEFNEQRSKMKFKGDRLPPNRIPLQVLASSSSEIAGFDVFSGSDTCPDREHSSFNDSDLTDESSSIDDHSGRHAPNRPVELLQGKDPDMVSCVAAILHLSSSKASSVNNYTPDLEIENDPHTTSNISSGREISTRQANNQVSWEKSFERLKQFQLQHGHCRVPPKRDKALSVWANNQRYQLHANRRFKYKQDRIALLDSIGFNWGCVHPRASRQVCQSNTEIANDLHLSEETELRDQTSDNGTIINVELIQQDSKEIECATAILALSNVGLPSPLKVQADASRIAFYGEECDAQRQHAFDREQQQRQVQHVRSFVPRPHDQAPQNWFMNHRPQRFGYPPYVQGRMNFYWGNRFAFTVAPHATTISSTEDSIVKCNFSGVDSCADPEIAKLANARNSETALNAMPRLSELPKNSAIGSDCRSSENDIQDHTGSESRDKETSNQHEVNWRKSFDRLKEFQIRTGHCQVPKNHDKTLYTWATNQRQLRNKGPRYKQERIDLLDSIGFNWGTSRIQSNNVLVTTPPNEVPDTYLDKSQLLPTEEQLEPEDKHMIDVGARDIGDTSGYQQAADFDRARLSVRVHLRRSLCSNSNEKNCGKEFSHEEDAPVAAGSRLSTNANNSPDDVRTNGCQKLKWQKNFDCLKRYKEEHGHCQVLRKHDKTLHSWVQNQRTSLGRHSSGYKQERVDALNSIGFIWSKKRPSAKGTLSTASPSNELYINRGMSQEREDATWKLMFERLKDFKTTNGHFRVPLEPHGELSSWILTQLSQLRDCEGYKKKRVDFLNSIGFPWCHGHPLGNDSLERGCNHADVENKPWIGNCWDQTNDNADCVDAPSKQPACLESTLLKTFHPKKRMKIA